MEWIIIIGIIIFAMNARNKRHSPKKRFNERSTQRSIQQSIPTHTDNTAPPFEPISITDILGGDTSNDSMELLKPAVSPHSPNFGSEGESLYGSYGDPYGCVGGSIAHDSHEGLEFEGHTHTFPTNADTAEKPKRNAEHPTRQPTHRTRLTTAQMRNAVIMAEILGKPVSCRRR